LKSAPNHNGPQGQRQPLQPLRFSSLYKQVIWGGTRIAAFKGEPSQLTDVGESWELSAIEGRESHVIEGPLKGLTLQQLIDEYGPDFLGSRLYEAGVRTFPLLVKLIDANDDLSLQVHPGEEIARNFHNCSGKAEMWYVIDALPGSRLLAGFNRQVNEGEYRAAVDDGSIIDAVASHPTHPGDVFYLPSGRIHAIGAGNFLLEVQQSSDITYRIYDYGRGRELHTDLAADALDYEVHHDYRSKPVKVGDNEWLLERAPEFEVRLIDVGSEIYKAFSGDSFVIMTCVSGEVEIEYDNSTWHISQGHTMLLPASLHGVTIRPITPKAQVVTATC
ncbi:MAG: class I mannose-6-phosphate isomerase, partial [Muribaculaceae bacterium]|nr:class I mannose-6-phosphate isomerase [Muribaculaceae bacterium]